MKISHDSVVIAEHRDKIADKISEDEIIIQVLSNALKLPKASTSDKLMIALSTIPEIKVDFSLAKNRFIKLLDLLETNKMLNSEEIMLFKHSVKQINSLQELRAKNQT